MTVCTWIYVCLRVYRCACGVVDGLNVEWMAQRGCTLLALN